MSLVCTEMSKREGLIELQEPQSIKVSGATQQLLDQITESMQPINAQRPFPPEIADRLKDALMPDRVVASLNMEGIVATRRQTIAVMHAMRVTDCVNLYDNRQVENADDQRAGEDAAGWACVPCSGTH